MSKKERYHEYFLRLLAFFYMNANDLSDDFCVVGKQNELTANHNEDALSQLSDSMVYNTNLISSP